MDLSRGFYPLSPMYEEFPVRMPVHMKLTRIRVPFFHVPANPGTRNKAGAMGFEVRTDVYQSSAPLMFRGLLEDVTQDANAAQLVLQKSLVEDETPMLFLNGKPLKPLEVLILVEDMLNKQGPFYKGFSLGCGSVAGVATALTIGGVVAPVIAALSFLGICSISAAFSTGIQVRFIIKLDKTKEPSLSSSDVYQAFSTLVKAGLLRKQSLLVDETYTLTKAGLKMLEDYRQRQGTGLTDGKSTIDARMADSQKTKGFSYADLTASRRALVFQTLTSACGGGVISGFQFLEKLQGLEKRMPWTARLFKKGMTESQVLGVLSDGEKPWGRDLLNAFQALGWVRHDAGKESTWFLTDAGRQVVALQDPAYTGVMTPEDVHAMFQANIERIEGLRKAEYQKVENILAEQHSQQENIKGLEARLSAELSETERTTTKSALAVGRQSLELLAGMLDAQQKLYEISSLKADAAILKLREGQLKLKMTAAAKGMAEVLASLGGLLAPSSELLLATVEVAHASLAADDLKTGLLAEGIVNSGEASAAHTGM